MKDVKSAADFYENKVNEVGVNIKDLEAIVQGKTNNVRVVEEGIIFVSVPRISNVADVIQLFSSETEDGGNDGSLESKENGPDPNLEDSAEVPSKDKALSRRTQRSDTNNRRQRLNARGRRKLLALKGKKMTLRQVGIQFTHLDTDILRQVWGELNLPERRTRSRTMRKK